MLGDIDWSRTGRRKGVVYQRVRLTKNYHGMSNSVRYETHFETRSLCEETIGHRLIRLSWVINKNIRT